MLRSRDDIEGVLIELAPKNGKAILMTPLDIQVLSKVSWRTPCSPDVP